MRELQIYQKTHGVSRGMLNILILLLWVCQFSGCIIVMDAGKTYQKTAHYERDQKLLSSGMAAYEARAYEKAETIFKSLQHAQDADIAGRALYGLACVALITAKTPDDLNAAMALWEQWRRVPAHTAAAADPRMLEPLVKRKTEISARPSKKPKKDTYVKKVLKAKEKEIETLKIKLDTAEKEKQTREAAQQHKMAVMEDEIKRLKHQIKSLEAIDQKLREKKKDIAVP
jgi:hypothetical protein